ncbi:MAG: TrkH family potassium uptake protein [Proteobacteria bacterium]|nr:TrkH family potassium uptake protein [Pseudomonadota bacterium]
MHWLRVLYPFGSIVAGFGVFMLLPALIAIIMQDQMALIYVFCGLAVIIFGALLVFIGRFFRTELQTRHGFILVCLIWMLLPCFAALPLMFALPDLSFTKGYFEAASGLTASGATVLVGLDTLPPSVNFWRSEMSWLGGMGLIVLATAILPLLGVGGSAVFQTELPGPIKDNKITPQVKETAKLLWVIYASLTLLCAIAYFLAGMTWLDAIIHSFTTLGLGGFSSHDASYGYFDSVAIEIVAIFFMIIAGMNFVTHFSVWRNKNPRLYFNSIEWRTYIVLLLFAIVTVFGYLHLQETYPNPWQTLRYSVFNTVSIVTTTGYSNTDYNAWPLFAPLLILIMANFTSCSGSTGGGVKLIRALIALKQAQAERLKLVHPAAYYVNKIGFSLSQKILVSILFFILAYITFAFILMLFLIATGMDFLTAFSAAVASISNTGPGLGEVGPASTYAHLADIQIWACAFAMLFGRLELMSFIVVLHRGFWRH